MPLSDRQRHLIDDWSIIDDRQERLAAIVERGRTADKLPAAARTGEHRLQGCVSAAWLEGRLDGDRLAFVSAADSPLVEGLLVLLCDFYSGETPDSVAAAGDADDPLELLGLTRDLSPTRRAGLASARGRIRACAAAFAAAAGQPLVAADCGSCTSYRQTVS